MRRSLNEAPYAVLRGLGVNASPLKNKGISSETI
jgi:hypothetical protein